MKLNKVNVCLSIASIVATTTRCRPLLLQVRGVVLDGLEAAADSVGSFAADGSHSLVSASSVVPKGEAAHTIGDQSNPLLEATSRSLPLEIESTFRPADTAVKLSPQDEAKLLSSGLVSSHAPERAEILESPTAPADYYYVRFREGGIFLVPAPVKRHNNRNLRALNATQRKELRRLDQQYMAKQDPEWRRGLTRKVREWKEAQLRASIDAQNADKIPPLIPGKRRRLRKLRMSNVVEVKDENVVKGEAAVSLKHSTSSKWGNSRVPQAAIAQVGSTVPQGYYSMSFGSQKFLIPHMAPGRSRNLDALSKDQRALLKLKENKDNWRKFYIPKRSRKGQDEQQEPKVRSKEARQSPPALLSTEDTSSRAPAKDDSLAIDQHPPASSHLSQQLLPDHHSAVSTTHNAYPESPTFDGLEDIEPLWDL